jgi:hypothetical protein
LFRLEPCQSAKCISLMTCPEKINRRINPGFFPMCFFAVLSFHQSENSRLSCFRYSKQAFLSDVQHPYQLPDKSPSFKDFMGNKNNRFINPAMASKNRIQPPSKVNRPLFLVTHSPIPRQAKCLFILLFGADFAFLQHATQFNGGAAERSVRKG